MNVRSVYMTPQLAAEMLKNNDGNRRLRPAVVKQYAAEMTAGMWRQTHQAIAVDNTGRLVDGQHRLTAVVQSNWSGELLIATYDSPEETLQLPVDRGARRQVYDVLNKPRTHVEVVHRLLRHVYGKTAAIHEVKRVLDMHEAKIERLWSLCVSRKRVVGSSCAISALLLTAYAERTEAETEESLNQYHAFFKQEYDTMWPHVRAFNAYLVTGDGARVTATNMASAQDLFLRVYLTFDARRKHLKISRVNNRDELKLEIQARAASLQLL